MKKRMFAAVLSLLGGAGAAGAEEMAILPLRLSQSAPRAEESATLPSIQQVQALTSAQDIVVLPIQPGAGEGRPATPIMASPAAHSPDATTCAPVSGALCCDPAPCTPRIWGGAEYLLWWFKGQNTGPLVTTTTNPNASANGFNVAGGVGRDGTVVLIGPGGSGVNYNPISGGRVTIGAWLDKSSKIGVEGSGFLTETGSFHRSFASGTNGSPVFGIPIVDVAGVFGGGENAVVESFPGLFTGSENVISHSRLWGAEANGVVNFLRNDRFSFDVLGGFRYADLKDDLSVIGISSNLVPAAGGGGVAFLNGFFDGTVTSNDSFRTRNQFYGGQIGARAEGQFGRVFVNVTSKIALGNNHQQVDIAGFSTLQTAGLFAVTPGGTLAVASNSGHRTHDVFSVIPEVEFKVGYNITRRVRGFVGYNFMYWSDVARAGQQIDRNVDVRQVPTIPGFNPAIMTQPTPQLVNTGFWAQGINFGLEFRF